jgi:predicted methyltransferase
MQRLSLSLFLSIFLLAGCQPSDDSAPPAQVDAPAVESPDPYVEPEPEPDEVVLSPSERLAEVVSQQPEEIQARIRYRNPKETLSFFGIEPGMTVVEGLPGGGWYTRILLPYLGSDGRLIAANYPIELFSQFDFATEEFLAGLSDWPDSFRDQAGEWCADDCAAVDTFWLGDLPENLQGRADAVLYIRVLQNMARFQIEGVDDYLDQAFANAFDVLRPGGVLGIVQHQAREDMPDDWATGANGYLKKSFVIAQAEAAGFELVGESAINENPLDQPTVDDFVWRLPPSLGTSQDDPELRAEMEAIGESHRMTLKFRKPEDGPAE